MQKQLRLFLGSATLLIFLGISTLGIAACGDSSKKFEPYPHIPDGEYEISSVFLKGYGGTNAYVIILKTPLNAPQQVLEIPATYVELITHDKPATMEISRLKGEFMHPYYQGDGIQNFAVFQRIRLFLPNEYKISSMSNRLTYSNYVGMNYVSGQHVVTMQRIYPFK